MAIHPWWLLVTAALSLTVANQRSFVDSASLAKPEDSVGENTQIEDGSVQELEKLKHSLGKTLAMMKSHSIEYSSNSNGHQDMHADMKEQVNQDGAMVASVNEHVDSEVSSADSKPITRVRTQVEVPSKGIHRTITQEPGREPVITDNGNRRALTSDILQENANNVNKYTSYSGVQYSPLDMAEYVFWTGDEKGVTMAIEEFLQEGLMTREEAIAFLQEIKYNLDYLQAHYSQEGLYSQERQKIFNDRVSPFHKYIRNNKQIQINNRNENQQYDLNDLRQDMNKKNNINENLEITKQDRSLEDDDYEELLEKLRMADFLYTEYSLEEVIYQLSKIMFTQSLTRGSAEAQAALQKFTNFLETEAEEGHISRALEKKVLDVLIAALTDTLTEHPELVPAAREGLGGGAPNLPDGNRLLRKLLEMGPLDKATMKAILSPYKEQLTDRTNHVNKDRITDLPNSKLTPLGFGKYKTP